ncbi:MAG: integrase domain-containing protein [Gammaproteobacteria bacterium]|nr:integrase domain-containing protein [Gammaproteobacteria bacterium]MDE0252701.1 integrase domain-containing protein [Gammaproteobacteria bacterium]MDE0402389.1 integrase domain-containing protein [Gammaproteobacteria bacterium]
MRQLEYEFKEMLRNNRDGSYGTQVQRKASLLRIARDLRELGFNQMNVHALKRKHVIALVKHWQELGISAGSQKNLLVFVRWWARKVGKYDLLPEENDSLRIPKRSFIPDSSKAQYLNQDILNKFSDERIRLSIELQQEFGLRRQESLLFKPSYAFLHDRVILKGSWTKGGRPRTIPLTTEYQRVLLDRIQKIAGAGSMIPRHLSYKQWFTRYKRVLKKHSLYNLHGLRHGYAQRRYKVLTGWLSPFENGPTFNDMTEEQRKIDEQARLQVSQELGHNRISITDVYLGKR